MSSVIVQCTRQRNVLPEE